MMMRIWRTRWSATVPRRRERTRAKYQRRSSTSPTGWHWPRGLPCRRRRRTAQEQADHTGCQSTKEKLETLHRIAGPSGPSTTLCSPTAAGCGPTRERLLGSIDATRRSWVSMAECSQVSLCKSWRDEEHRRRNVDTARSPPRGLCPSRTASMMSSPRLLPSG